MANSVVCVHTTKEYLENVLCEISLTTNTATEKDGGGGGLEFENITAARRRRRDGCRFPLPAAVSHFDYSEPDVGYIWGNVGGYYSCSAAERAIHSKPNERTPLSLLS